MVWGYHVYKEVCNAEVYEEMMCEREVGNHNSMFTITMKKETVIVGSHIMIHIINILTYTAMW